MLKKVKLLVLRTSGFAIAGSLAIAGQAQAQSVDVNFTGNVGSTCTFGAPTAGVLQAADGGIVGVSGLGNFPTLGPNTGTPATVTLNCTNGGTLGVGAPQTVAEPAGFAPAVRESLAVVNGNRTSGFNGANFTGTTTAPIAVPAGAQTVTVGMIAGTGGAPAGALPPSGTYNYTVTLTATPQ